MAVPSKSRSPTGNWILKKSYEKNTSTFAVNFSSYSCWSRIVANIHIHSSWVGHVGWQRHWQFGPRSVCHIVSERIRSSFEHLSLCLCLSKNGNEAIFLPPTSFKLTCWLRKTSGTVCIHIHYIPTGDIGNLPSVRMSPHMVIEHVLEKPLERGCHHGMYLCLDQESRPSFDTLVCKKYLFF